MKKIISAFLLITVITHAQPSQTQPSIVASIYPLQQIANEISGQTTDLLADSYLSPHNYALKPSDVNKIIHADLVIWIGEAMMPQLGKYLGKRGKNKPTITASKLADIQLIKGESHDEQHNENSHEDHAHNELSYDPHLWLSTHNAQVIAAAIAEALIKLDPTQKKTYQHNLKTFTQKLQQTHDDLLNTLTNTPPQPYFVFHDAYAYFEREFGVAPAAMIRLHAGQVPKTKHLVKLKKQLQSYQQVCLFSEPQFKSPLVKSLTQGTNVTVSTLDPLGYQADKQIGYSNILKNIAQRLIQCRIK